MAGGDLTEIYKVRRGAGQRLYYCSKCDDTYFASPEKRHCPVCGNKKAERECKRRYKLRNTVTEEEYMQFLKSVRRAVRTADLAYEAEMLGVSL